MLRAPQHKQEVPAELVLVCRVDRDRVDPYDAEVMLRRRKLGHGLTSRGGDLLRHLVTDCQVRARALEVEEGVARALDDLVGVAVLWWHELVSGGEHLEWCSHVPLGVVCGSGF